MFFLHELERVITLPPSRFGPHVEECLRNKLLEDVEGTCTGQYYIVCVMDTYDISEGRVLPSSGVAEYTIHYRAVVWRPFKGETVGFSLHCRLWSWEKRRLGFFFTEIHFSLFRHHRSMPSLLLSTLMVYSRKSDRCQSSSRIMYVFFVVLCFIWHLARTAIPSENKELTPSLCM